MSFFAYDIFASSAVADVSLDGRVATSGQVWQKLSVGFSSSLTLRYTDSTGGDAPKRVNPAGNQRLNYLQIAATGRSLKAIARRAVLSTEARARGFLGIGFTDANGNGYFGGWANNSLPQTTNVICRSNGAAGTLDTLATWASAAPFSAPFARQIALEYDRETGDLSFSWDGVKVASVTDLSYSPSCPAVIAHDLATATPVDALLDVAYEQSGSFTPSSTALVWKPLGVGDWRADLTVNFGEYPTFSFNTAAQLLQGYVRARTIVFSSFDAPAEATVSMDGVAITLTPGAELVLPAPKNEIVTLTGLIGVLRARLYSIPYELYQRG